MSCSINDILNEFCGISFLSFQFFIHQFTQQLNEVDVAPLIVATNIVSFSQFPIMKYTVDGICMIFYVQPIPYIDAFAINGQLFVGQNIVDEKGDQFFGKLIRAIIVGTIAQHNGGGIPQFVKLSFAIGSVSLLAAVLVPVFSTKEFPPEVVERKKSESFSSFLKSYFGAFKNIPSSFLKLAPTQFFTWIGLFLMWFYLTPAIATNIFKGTPGDISYNEGVVWGNICIGFYSFVTFLCALVLPKIETKIGKIDLHFWCLIIGGLGLISILGITNKWLLFLSMAGVGIAWTSIVATPYSIIAKDIPPKQMGLFMGLFNFFIVIPEILATLFFGKIMNSVLQNNRLYAIALGGAMLIVGALLLKLFFHKKEA